MFPAARALVHHEKSMDAHQNPKRSQLSCAHSIQSETETHVYYNKINFQRHCHNILANISKRKSSHLPPILPSLEVAACGMGERGYKRNSFLLRGWINIPPQKWIAPCVYRWYPSNYIGYLQYIHCNYIIDLWVYFWSVHQWDDHHIPCSVNTNAQVL